MNTSSKQSGFSIVEGVITIVVIAVLGFIGWTVYNTYSSKHATKTSNQSTKSQTSASDNTKTNPSSQQNAPNPNSITDYFAPANISFSHDKTWTWDTTGETYGYYEHPNEKTAKLTLPYQGANDTRPSRYNIGFISDSIPPSPEPTLGNFTKLGQATLGSQTLYILHGYYTDNPSYPLDKIISSGCSDKQCSFLPTGSNLYFSVSVDKSIQNPTPIDSSIVPVVTNILQSMQLGKQ